MAASENRPNIGPIQIGGILLALAASGIHLYFFAQLVIGIAAGVLLFLALLPFI